MPSGNLNKALLKIQKDAKETGIAHFRPILLKLAMPSFSI